MISEGSCDMYGCWKFRFAITGINYNLKYIKTENSYLIIIVCNNITGFYCIYLFIFVKTGEKIF